LAQLDAGVTIKAFTSTGEIKKKPLPKQEGGQPAPQWADRLDLIGEPGVDQERIDSVADFLAEHHYDPGRLLVVNGQNWTCYIRCVLHHLNRIQDYPGVILGVTNAGIPIRSGVTIGTKQENDVIAAIREVTGAPFHAIAYDVAQRIEDRSQEQLDNDGQPANGDAVPLVLTGAHFNLRL
jgi:hypothetical protein